MRELKVMMRWHSCGSFARVGLILDLDQSRGRSKDGFTTEAQDTVKGADEGFKMAGSAIYVNDSSSRRRCLAAIDVERRMPQEKTTTRCEE